MVNEMVTVFLVLKGISSTSLTVTGSSSSGEKPVYWSDSCTWTRWVAIAAM